MKYVRSRRESYPGLLIAGQVFSIKHYTYAAQLLNLINDKGKCKYDVLILQTTGSKEKKREGGYLMSQQEYLGCLF